MLKHLLATVHQGITVVDSDLHLVLANETARRLLDLPVELIERMASLDEFIRFNAERGDYGPGDVETLVQERVALARRREAHDFVRQRPDGTVLRIQGTPMPDGGFVTIYTDVTEAHHREIAVTEKRDLLAERLEERTEELRKGHDLLVNAVNAVIDGLVVTDADGRIILTNGTFDTLFPNDRSWAAEEADIVDTMRRLGPAGLAEALEGLENDPETPCEFRIGKDRWYRVSRRANGENGMVTYKFADITTFKNQHRTLQRHTDKLVKMLRDEQKINEMQHEFVSMASHEFRTPLAIIDSNAQRLKRGLDRLSDNVAGAVLDTDAVAKRLSNIRESVDRMQYLINRFLSFSQHQSGALEITPAPSPLRELVQRACIRQQSVCATHRIHTDLDGLPDSAMIDARLVEQCVSNILSNAIKYSPGKDSVRVEGLTDGRFAVIRFVDQGVGIPESEIPKICNRYYRASTSSGIPGTGIGLNMTHMIVTEHRGQLHVTSETGRGTVVEIRLPHHGETTGTPLSGEAVI
ncbi:PAS-domain containing protein [Stappia sp.]|uniref:sensor histidine kinase n=1 Tax=Stappia sp. TaxID=1870903 RepID=UPI003A99D6B8